MKYFKNTELAKLYNISEKSVRNWIESSKKGRIDLELFASNGKDYIANTSRNAPVIEELVSKGKKYKNSRGFKTITPNDHFYSVYNTSQILDIISSLSIHHELPLQYTYVDGGADYWDQYASRLIDETSPNMLVRTIQLLDLSMESIDRLAAKYKKINLIDLGPGNALPIKNLLNHLLAKKVMGRYIAVDISKEMLHIAERNLKDWFGHQISFEGHVRDIRYERFNDLLIDKQEEHPEEVLNIAILFGGTLSNFRSPDQCLQAINNSLGLNDLFLYCTRLDTPNSRRHFDFASGTERTILDSHDKFLPDLLNIDESYYDVEQYYDTAKQARFIKIRLKVALQINFKLPNGVIRAVNLHKNDAVLLFRYWHLDGLGVIKQLDRNDFDFLYSIKSEEQEYLLAVSRIKIAE